MANQTAERNSQEAASSQSEAAPRARVTRLERRSAPSNAVTIDQPVDEARRVEVLSPPRRSRRRTPWGLLSFLLFVIAPVAASAVYYGFFASDQYIAEARFAVRSLSGGQSDDDNVSSGGTLSLLATSSVPQDAYVVASFIHSPEMLRRLNEKVDVRSFFDGETIDPLSRLKADASSEGMLGYWGKHVITYIDGPSGIVTLYVRAFSPEAAQQLAKMVTDESEILVNQLSERARVDIVARAQKEVQSTEQRYRAALDGLNVYQNESGILNPATQADETGKLLIQLMAQKLEVDSRLFVLTKSVTDESPAALQLKRTQTSLQGQIDKLRAEMAGSATADDNLSKALKRFSELEVDRLLASGLYEASRRNLASAQAEAIRKSVYVTVFVPPDLPQEARYPKRLSSVMLLLLGCFVAWGIGRLVWASVEDHRL